VVLAEAVAAAVGADLFTKENDRGRISYELRRGRVPGSRVLFEGDPQDWRAPAGAEGAAEAILAPTRDLATAIRGGEAPASLPTRLPAFRARRWGAPWSSWSPP
jgi:hypothetical protein